MRTHLTFRSIVTIRAVALSAMLLSGINAFAQAPRATQKPFEPQVGQAGKDVVWVPSPQTLVDKMLDMAKITQQDFLMDLGSGDGITVITAAKRGIRALGIEYNPEMVELSKRKAAAAGVTDKATFVKADLFETDLSKATVITMFLLPAINIRLRPIILDLKPGTRIVSNTFDMEDWLADESQSAPGECTSWCTALLWIVPAKVQGTWQLPQGELALKQQFQMISGTLGGKALTAATLRGDEIAFTVDNVKYTGKVDGATMRGTVVGGAPWTATRR